MSLESEPNRKVEAYSPDFDIHESRKSTEEKPVLLLTHAGVSFEASLDLIKNTFSVTHHYSETDTDPDQARRLKVYAEKIVAAELQDRRDKYSEYFS